MISSENNKKYYNDHQKHGLAITGSGFDIHLGQLDIQQ